ncbi:DNA mismatch repair protein mutl [Sporothrix schenckii 1099-18]|uniref:DNA mismatch repair protein mutl n=1 Tax=Sporothrix schenckii 1099-18 TaxID=1397361 RepID=A0A0F2MHC9_SPOSC|nr:DNA mismatch repair protein mutl [Sporothrix schenckii 1099-18]KJR88454.1 DNA mismatch repair protein mutl [Sporothrix schenckii 1099-18]
MSIKALPADACRLLGSTSVIATSISLVKELLDNAIDAGATAIDVIVSPNTVDKIEVRDNGHGISTADFDALGRRGHTSKLRQFDDLMTVGGTSLGFRGEGLASANTLGFVAITTRTAEEAIASKFRLVPNIGGISPDG